MPELPEVETTCRGIRQEILVRKITKIIVRESRLRWKVSKEINALCDLKISSITRRAKYILINTNQGTIIIHLGMSGRLRIVENTVEHGKHDHVDFILDNNKRLRFTDPRRFGSILWTKNDPLTHPLLVNLGPEPLSKEFNAHYLYQYISNKKQAIKLFIMNQKTVVGVGNIYANEALFAAKIHPHRSASSLTQSECAKLVKMIQKTLIQAIKEGGTTLRDFLSPSGKIGYFVQKLFVYGRENENCLVCKTLLSSSRIGQRATVFCTNCQK